MGIELLIIGFVSSIMLGLGIGLELRKRGYGHG